MTSESAKVAANIICDKCLVGKFDTFSHEFVEARIQVAIDTETKVLTEALEAALAYFGACVTNENMREIGELPGKIRAALKGRE
jgi:hypothetical protein